MPKAVVRKESVILRNRGSLGESSGNFSSSDDNSTPDQSEADDKENYTHKERRRTHNRSKGRSRKRLSEGTFRTPDNESNVTDYGLEFTTSRIQNPSPRRCSTLKSASSQERNESAKQRDKKSSSAGTTLKEVNDDLSGRLNKEKPKQPVKAKGKQKQSQTPIVADNISITKSNSEVVEENLVRKNRRKRKTPMQKNRLFLNEVKRLQKQITFLIPRLSFSRVIREVMMEASQEVSKITPTALEALQAASEMYLTQRLQDAYMLTLHRGRVTLDAKDMQLINFLKMYL